MSLQRNERLFQNFNPTPKIFKNGFTSLAIFKYSIYFYVNDPVYFDFTFLSQPLFSKRLENTLMRTAPRGIFIKNPPIFSQGQFKEHSLGLHCHPFVTP